MINTLKLMGIVITVWLRIADYSGIDWDSIPHGT